MCKQYGVAWQQGDTFLRQSMDRGRSHSRPDNGAGASAGCRAARAQLVATCLSLLLAVLLLSGWPATGRADEPGDSKQAPPTTSAADQAQLEKQFEQTLSGATLIGFFTRSDRPEDPLHEDRYTISQVKPLKNGYWLFEARIQYEGRDLKVPLPLLVRWAGDTPVITVDRVLVPGLGVFTARVLIYGDQYAGTWDAGDHGGQMFGRIVRETDSSEQSTDEDEKDAGEKDENAEPPSPGNKNMP